MGQSGTLAAVGIPTPPISFSFRHPGRDPLTNRIVGVEDPHSADSNNHVRHDFAFEFYTLLQKIQNLKQVAATIYIPHENIFPRKTALWITEISSQKWLKYIIQKTNKAFHTNKRTD